MQIFYKNVNDLKPYKNNARTHTPEQIAEIAEGIKAFGFLDPIEVDKNNVIISGHARLEAAISIGLEQVPTIAHENLTDAQRKAYTLAANKLATKSGWDSGLLKEEFEALKTDDMDLSLTGFTDDEIEDLLNPEELNPMEDEDAEQQEAAHEVSKLGDIWLLGEHRLMCGDSTVYDQVAALIWNHTPNLMVTDPPYGVNYDPEWRNETEDWINSAKNTEAVINDDRIDWKDAYSLFPGNIMYVWHAGKYAPIVGTNIIDCGFELTSQIIWVKQNFAVSRGNYHWQHEPCWYAVRKNCKHDWRGGRDKSTVWQIDNNNTNNNKEETFGHSTQKPVECMLRPIQNHTRTNDYVYDPFGGSGTTLIACEKIGRKCLMMEILPKYCDMIIRRWQKVTGKLAILESTGEPFHDL